MGDEEHPITPIDKFQLSINVEEGYSIRHSRVLVWSLRNGEPPAKMNGYDLKKQNQQKAERFMEFSAECAGPCVMCLYSRSRRSDLASKDDKKVLFDLSAKSCMFYVAPIIRKCKFSISHEVAHVEDQVEFTFETVEPIRYESTILNTKIAVHVSGNNCDMITGHIEEKDNGILQGSGRIIVQQEDTG